jgi:hypothetical protein
MHGPFGCAKPSEAIRDWCELHQGYKSTLSDCVYYSLQNDANPSHVWALPNHVSIVVKVASDFDSWHAHWA